ncbi:esterase [Frigoribacterium sp. CFBP 13729]|uniref:alpha/beta hydrolase n=1 Tax=Frigoribacterium sp. CFBP 13729 TaxID=2775293 RepID=UPI0017871F58|nr:alpha/beta hydrolase-fold protein [Frigoribacterium sp. CFBP 13729]MBD8611025.1 esterase [Frigoribacterium sp. CFBP 13729]
MSDLWELSLVSTWTLLVVDLVAAALMLAALRGRLRDRRRWAWVVAAAAAGAGIGAAASWWLGDVLDVADVPPTWVDRIWVALLGAATGALVVAAVRGGAGRRALAAVAVVSVVLAAGLAVNRDAGLFPTVAALTGRSTVSPLRIPAGEAATTGETADGSTPWSTWRAPAGMPARGRLGSVDLPGTTSGFPARPAIVWLPPAALTADPPALPVVVLLSGQGPGASAENLVEAGQVPSALDSLAAAHSGLAPIVVMPDQLGRPTSNPMCVDGALGNSATYLTVDVPRWVSSHLHVLPTGAGWAIGGFSQGGTCSVQLAAGHRGTFGSLVDVSGQLGPELDGGVARTIRLGFGGDRRAYDAAQPVAVLAAGAPYPGSAAFFAVGADDTRYGPAMPVVATAARAAGMAVVTERVPASAHDWHTASIGLADGLAWFEARSGLAAG